MTITIGNEGRVLSLSLFFYSVHCQNFQLRGLNYYIILDIYLKKAQNNIVSYFDAWLSLVERGVRDAEVAGSNPVASMGVKRC